MNRILKFKQLLESFKNPKDQDLYQKIIDILKSKSLTQLAICNKLGFESYDMRTTMVIREMTGRGELLKSDDRPMMFSLNPNYKEGETARLIIKPRESKIKSVGSKKLSLAELQDLMKKVELDFRYWNPGGDRGDYPKAAAVQGQQFELSADFRHLGDWENDYEDEDDFEDDDQMIWSRESRKFYSDKFGEWIKKQSWYDNVISWSIESGEKNWVYFRITVGNKTVNDVQHEKDRLIRQKEEEKKKRIADREAKAKARLERSKEREVASKRSKVKGVNYHKSLKNLEDLQEDFIEYKRQLKKVYKSNSLVIKQFDEKYKFMKTTIKKIINKNPDIDWLGSIDVRWYDRDTKASILFYVGAYTYDLLDLYSKEWEEWKEKYTYAADKDSFASDKQGLIINKALGIDRKYNGGGYIKSYSRVLYKITSMEAK